MERRLLGIIGRSISYTLSPAMHSEAIEALGLPYSYGVFDVSAEMLPGLFDALRAEHVRGANVTKPHKQAVMPYMDELSDEARALGAVNTIINEDGRLRGENTDVDGVRASLMPHRNAIRGCSVFVLGAGGASRAVIYAAAECSPRTIAVYNRNPERARELTQSFRDLFPDVAFEAVEASRIPRAVGDSALIVNTTTVGMPPDTSALPVPETLRFSIHQIIFDIIYTPLQTALLQKAEADGASVINGLEMFIQQGARAFTLWTGREFPAARARERVLRELGRR
ncbi:MAG: shikimate dehydrogenase [Acidobacteriota bacterium]